jgi:transposase
MSQTDRDRLVALRKAEDRKITQRQAAEELQLSERQVRRLLAKLRTEGDRAVIHGLRGRRSNRRIGEEKRQEVIGILQQEKYRGFGPTLASEYLEKKHRIGMSKETVRKWMREAGLWRARRERVEEIHQWRPRRERFGELVQWDTSEHDWLEGRGEKIYLIKMIDDATSRLFARFVRQDSTVENLAVLEQYLRLYGRPLEFYTDKAEYLPDHAEEEPRAARRAASADADRAGVKRARRGLDRGALTASEGTGRAQLPDGAGPPGEGAAGGSGQDIGAGQRLSGVGVSTGVE